MTPVKLTPRLLELAYRKACFPMADGSGGDIAWYEPDPRTILPITSFHVPKRLARTIRRNIYTIRIDTEFEAVIRACADRKETWISEDIIRCYCQSHNEGLCHSVEAWDGGRLVGGLYGVTLGAAFMGESMFSRARDASKICLVYLIKRLQTRRYELLDAQLPNPHLVQFGAIPISSAEYRARLAKALKKKRCFTDD